MNINTKQQETEKKLYYFRAEILRLVMDMYRLYVFDYQRLLADAKTNFPRFSRIYYIRATNALRKHHQMLFFDIFQW